MLGYSVLEVHGRLTAVPSGALRPGPGQIELSVLVDDVVDLVERRDIVGRIGDVRVHVAWADGSQAPARGERLLVHAERAYDLT